MILSEEAGLQLIDNCIPPTVFVITDDGFGKECCTLAGNIYLKMPDSAAQFTTGMQVWAKKGGLEVVWMSARNTY